KEVIQPHLPIRLPCYDFTPVTNPAVVIALLAVRLTTSGRTRSHGVTGAIPTSRSRVADCDPDYDWFYGISSPSRVGNPLYQPLYDVCSPTYKGHEDLTSSPPSS
ncbi:hypothetical protein KXX11_004482, partial [Aspergillus fumigatus]